MKTSSKHLQIIQNYHYETTGIRFMGRDMEVKSLISKITNPQYALTILMAGPKNSGKTSLLRAMGCPSLELHQRSTEIPLVFLRIDLRESKSLSSFMQAIISAFYSIYYDLAFPTTPKIFEAIQQRVFKGLIFIAQHLAVLLIKNTSYYDKLQEWISRSLMLSDNSLEELIDIIVVGKNDLNKQENKQQEEKKQKNKQQENKPQEEIQQKKLRDLMLKGCNAIRSLYLSTQSVGMTSQKKRLMLTQLLKIFSEKMRPVVIIDQVQFLRKEFSQEFQKLIQDLTNLVKFNQIKLILSTTDSIFYSLQAFKPLQPSMDYFEIPSIKLPYQERFIKLFDADYWKELNKYFHNSSNIGRVFSIIELNENEDVIQKIDSFKQQQKFSYFAPLKQIALKTNISQSILLEIIREIFTLNEKSQYPNLHVCYWFLKGKKVVQEHFKTKESFDIVLEKLVSENVLYMQPLSNKIVKHYQFFATFIMPKI